MLYFIFYPSFYPSIYHLISFAIYCFSFLSSYQLFINPLRYASIHPSLSVFNSPSHPFFGSFFNPSITHQSINSFIHPLQLHPSISTQPIHSSIHSSINPSNPSTHPTHQLIHPSTHPSIHPSIHLLQGTWQGEECGLGGAQDSLHSLQPLRPSLHLVFHFQTLQPSLHQFH